MYIYFILLNKAQTRLEIVGEFGNPFYFPQKNNLAPPTVTLVTLGVLCFEHSPASFNA